MPAVRLGSIDGFSTIARSIVQAVNDDNPGSCVRQMERDWVVEHPTRLVVRWPRVEQSIAGQLSFRERHRTAIRLAFDGVVEEAEWVAEVQAAPGPWRLLDRVATDQGHAALHEAGLAFLMRSRGAVDDCRLCHLVSGRVVDVTLKKEQELALLYDFFADFDRSGKNRWMLSDVRERPDFVVEYAGRCLGVEVTELLTKDSGRERAGERDLTKVICEVVRRVIGEYAGRGAIVDGYLSTLPRRSRDAADLSTNFAEHLKQHGAALADDGGVMDAPFSFAFGRIQRVQRDDARGTVDVFRNLGHQTTDTDRDREELEAELLTTVQTKVAKASGYSRTHPLWLVVRNPYYPLPSISMASRERIAEVNAGTFEQIFCYSLRMNQHRAVGDRAIIVPCV